MELQLPDEFVEDAQTAFEYWKTKRLESLRQVQVDDNNADALMKELMGVESMTFTKWIGKLISPVVSKLLAEKREESLDNETTQETQAPVSDGQGTDLADKPCDTE